MSFTFKRSDFDAFWTSSLEEGVLKRINPVLLTLSIILTLELFFLFLRPIPDVTLLLQLVVVYVAFRHGIMPALQSAALIWLYLIYYFAIYGNLLRFNIHDLFHLISAGISLPVIAILVGILRLRSDLRLKQLLELDQERMVNRALANKEREYRLLYEKNVQPMWIFDQETLQFLSVNQAAIKFYGYSKKEFLSMTLKDIRPKQDVSVLLKSIEQFKDIKDVLRTEAVHYKKDGILIDVEVYRTPIKFYGQEAFLVLINDITLRKRVDQMKNDFLSMASHELKTPITTLKLLTESHLRRGKVGMKIDELRLMDQELDRLTRLIEEMLDINRIETGKFKHNIELVDLNGLVLDVVSQMRSITPSHKIVFGKGSNRVAVVVDPNRIRQVLINLISNAIKYSEPGSVVMVLTNQVENKAVVEVRDQGRGIPPQKQPYVFDRFYQAEETNTGFGLGLYISKEIMLRHKGKIWLRSEVGKGSSFFLSLPIAKSY